MKISSPSLSILTVTQPKASVIVVATVALIAPPAIVPTAGTNFKTFPTRLRPKPTTTNSLVIPFANASDQEAPNIL